MTSHAAAAIPPETHSGQLRSDSVLPRYAAGWLGAAGLGMVNAAAREAFYRNRVGELPAHQISTATLFALLAGYLWALERRWPIPSARSALAIGAMWLLLTVVFEFGFGHFVAGRSRSYLLHDYNLAQGRVWGFVPVWMAVGPLAIRRLRNRQS